MESWLITNHGVEVLTLPEDVRIFELCSKRVVKLVFSHSQVEGDIWGQMSPFPTNYSMVDTTLYHLISRSCIILFFLKIFFCGPFFKSLWNFQMALMVKNQPANVEDVRATSSISGRVRSPGGGHGNPLQYFHLENPMDRGAWRATVHRVATNTFYKKWSRLLENTCKLQKWPLWGEFSASATSAVASSA